MDRDYRRNYFLLFMDTVIFVNAMTFLSMNSVMPYFLNTLGASTFQISLISALNNIGIFMSQLLFAKKAMASSLKIKPFVKILTVQRVFFMAFVCTIPLFALRNPAFMIIWFLTCWGIFSFFIGSYAPFYTSIMSKMIPYRNRGRLLGYSGAVASISALGASYIINVLLKNVRFPLSYTYIFGLGAILLLLDNVDFLLMKEPPERVEDNALTYKDLIKNIFKILATNKKFANLVLIYSLIVIANMPLAYYTVYAVKEFGAANANVAIFTAIPLVVNVLGNIMFGLIADHFSHRRVLQIATILGTAAGIVILAVHSMLGVYMAFALSSLCVSGYFLSGNVLITRTTGLEKLPLYISINNMITLAVSSVSFLISGRIIDVFSFAPIFVVTTLAALSAFALLHFAVCDEDFAE